MFASAIQRLKATYTDDYEVWRGIWVTHCNSPSLLASTDISPMEVVNLFHTTGQTRLLPTALFLCLELPIDTLLDGARRADGTLEQLSKEDLCRCLEARDAYALKVAHLWSVPWQPSMLIDAMAPPGCTQWSRCRRTIAILRDLFLEKPWPVEHRNVFANADYQARMVTVMLSRKQGGSDICAACADRIADGARQVFRAQWDALPRILELTDVVTDWPSAAPL